jgi:hypothetical protein
MLNEGYLYIFITVHTPLLYSDFFPELIKNITQLRETNGVLNIYNLNFHFILEEVILPRFSKLRFTITYAESDCYGKTCNIATQAWKSKYKI